MATDTTIAVPSVAGPSVQANVDASQVTNSALATTVVRENVVVADPNNFTGQAAVGPKGLQVDDSNNDLLKAILAELRVHTAILAATLGYQEDPDLMRNDVSWTQQLPQ